MKAHHWYMNRFVVQVLQAGKTYGTRYEIFGGASGNFLPAGFCLAIVIYL